MLFFFYLLLSRLFINRLIYVLIYKSKVLRLSGSLRRGGIDRDVFCIGIF